jgi:sporulation protein YlmC with PRC-barrel domain
MGMCLFYLDLPYSKMPQFYNEKELKGTLVVDSEGLIYGRVSKISVEEDGIKLHVSVDVRAEVEEIDVEKLRDLLKDKISSEAEEEEIVSLAKSLGLEIPKKLVRRDLPHEKGVVPIEQIACIAEGDGVRIIVLSTPREANYRGIRERKPEYADLTGIKGKIVISLSGEVLGEASDVVVSAEGPGIRVKRLSAKKTINWLRLLRDLRREQRNAALKLETKLDPYKNPRIPVEEADEVAELLKGEGIDPNLLEKYLEEPEGHSYVDVAWEKIKKIGDVVLVEQYQD